MEYGITLSMIEDVEKYRGCKTSAECDDSPVGPVRGGLTRVPDLRWRGWVTLERIREYSGYRQG